MSAPYMPQLQGIPALPTDRYWAAVEPEDLPSMVVAKALRYRERLRRDGRLELWRRAERTYYGQDANGGFANSVAVTFGGEDGETVCVRVNHFASLVQGILALAVTKRPAYDPRATNSDAESAQQVTLAKSLLDYYTRRLNLEGRRQDVARTAQLTGEGYTALRWNPWIGDPYTTERRPIPGMVDTATGAPATETIVVREGDVEAHVFGPLEVVHDMDTDSEAFEWVLVPYRENVWNLAARYPEQRDDILSLRGSGAQRWPRSAWSDAPWERNNVAGETDIVTVWWLYHLPCDALPQGRHAQVVGSVVLHDGPMELSEVPVYQQAPEREVSVSRGHSRMFDLLALQEALDSIWMSMLTCIDGGAVNMVAVAKGTDISPSQLGRSSQLIEYEPNPDAPNAGLPSVLSLLQLPASLPAAAEMLTHVMETLCGINSTVRGDPLPQLKSGAALALVQSLAVAFNSALQGAVVRHDERVASGLIALLKRYAHNQRLCEIVGRAQRGAMRSWSRDDLSTVARVTIDVGSPLQDQTAGKLEIASQLLAQGKVDAAEYIEVLTTGRLEPLYRGPKAALDLISRENEQLSDGVQCVTRLTDDHALHVQEHSAVLSELHVRNDEKRSALVLAHIQAHQQMWQSMGPELGALTKQSVMPPPIVPTAPAPNGAPSQGAKPGAPAGLAPPSVNPHRAMPLGQAANTPEHGPFMPTNPLTGEHAPNPAGT